MRYYVEKLWYKLIYSILTIIYLIKLNIFNKELIAQNLEAFDLLIYKDYCALKYFLFAVVFFMLGAIIIYSEIKRIKEYSENIRDILISVASMIIVFILLILIIALINNPILKAILTVLLVAVGVISISNT